MANHKSAIKRARQSEHKAALNSRTKNSVRTYEKKLRKALDAKDKGSVQQLLVAFASKAGKAAQKGVLSPKAVSRKVGRLAKQVHQLEASK